MKLGIYFVNLEVLSSFNPRFFASLTTGTAPFIFISSKDIFLTDLARTKIHARILF